MSALSAEKARVLLVGTRTVRAAEISRGLRGELSVEAAPFEVTKRERVQRTRGYDALLLDTEELPPERRAEEVRSALGVLRAGDPAPRVLVLVPEDDVASARAALDAGAWDVIPSELGSQEIAERLLTATSLSVLEALDEPGAEPPAAAASYLQDAAVTAPAPILGASQEMQRVLALIRRLAVSDVPVLITGESGTGKELAALAIHQRSIRAQGPFVPINCAAVPENLLESELFGHDRGAFTGATRARAGRVETAAGGTLFLDEIGELALPLQVKLLRFLEDHRVQRVGETRTIPVDVRVIAATNQDLSEELRAGRFREDLYYRINVFTLSLPPLRERRGDVIVLAKAFLEREYANGERTLRGFSPEAIAALSRATWPGNVRELLNCVHRATVVAEGELVTAGDLGLPPEGAEESGPTLSRARSQAEIEAVRAALARTRGNKSEAARLLDISRTQLYEIMHRHDIVDASGEGSPRPSGDR
jgi:two-component system NtrC family response regulator